MLEKHGEWILGALWKANSSKCQLGLIDTVLIDPSGMPELWLFTSKSGEVVKKRQAKSAEILERFLKITSQNRHDQHWCAVGRQMDGSIIFYDQSSFVELMGAIPTSTRGIVALQPFIETKGNKYTVLRNELKITKDKSRNITSTTKASYMTTEKKSTDVSENLHLRPPKDFPIKFTAANITSKLDNITLLTLRHIEALHHYSVQQLTLDYMIDELGQIWVSWAKEIQFSKSKTQQEHSSGSQQRSLAEDETLDESRAQLNYERTTEAMIEHANKVVDPGSISALSPMQKLLAGERKVVHINPRSKSDNLKLKCSGDYCSCTLNAPKELATDTSHVLSQFFNSEEMESFSSQHLDQLTSTSHPKGAHLPSETSAPGDVSSLNYTITYKSIALAKKERRGLEAGLLLPSEKAQQKSKKSKSNFMEDTISKSIKSNWAKQMGEIDGGASNYYRHVKICGNCYAIYSMLDTARDILSSQRNSKGTSREAEKYQQSRKVWNEEVDERTTKMEKILRRKKVDLDLGMDTSSSPSKPLLSSAMLDTDDSAMIPIQLQMQQSQPGSSASSLLPNVVGSNTDRLEPHLKPPQERGKGETEQLPLVDQPQSNNQLSNSKQYQAQDRPRPWKQAYEHQNKMTLAKQEMVKSTNDSDPNEKEETYAGLDNYLRGKSRRRQKRQLDEGKLFPNPRHSTYKAPGKPGSNKPLGKKKNRKAQILVIEDDEAVNFVQAILDPYFFKIDRIQDGILAVEKLKLDYDKYDVILVGRDLPGLSGIEVTKLLRLYETQKAIAAQNPSTIPTKRLKMIAYTKHVSPDDMCVYMEAGLDGCVSQPPDPDSLLRTIAAALPDFQTQMDPVELTPKTSGQSSHDTSRKSNKPKSKPKGQGKQTNGAVNPLPAKALPDGSTSYGNFQMDADTVFPYVVLKHGNPIEPPASTVTRDIPFFNLVIVHDFFDTFERLQIFFQPLLKRYPGVQILCWNYPGQAFTEWRRDVLLNNEYLSTCLSALLHHVGDNGTKEFRSRPFVLLGFGNGGSIATCYASGFPSPNLRSLVLVNAFCYIDSNLSSILHDCMNIFSCSPASRPDVPIYFYSRFLFSKAFLSETTVPLALNLYTAVHNPITLEGRIQLCLGALSHADMRDGLAKHVNVPVITISSSENKLVKSIHTDAIVSARGGQVDSIHDVLMNRLQKKTCVIWLKTGHEVFLEAKTVMLGLFEQLVTGYHEFHNVPTPVAIHHHPQSLKKQLARSKTNKHHHIQEQRNFEDKFIDSVIQSIARPPEPANNVVSTTTTESQAPPAEPWPEYQKKAEQRFQKGLLTSSSSNPPKNGKSKTLGKSSKKAQAPQPAAMYQMNPDSPAFERQQNRIYDIQEGNKIYPSTNPNVPQVKEYMHWRVTRNKKKLLRLDKSALVLQRAFRAFIARTLVKRMRHKSAVMTLQRSWRGLVARREYSRMKKKDWAIRLVQRQWRGRAGRAIFTVIRIRKRAAIQIQRLARGHVARVFVAWKCQQREDGARLIQGAFRRRQATLVTMGKRAEKQGAVTIQRSYRGHLGRKRAKAERSRFLFSKSQSRGIEFGRQMLVEHKLHGTRLQSEVVLLSNEKAEAETKVAALVNEITDLEQGVNLLEREMHELSTLETQANGALLDEDARFLLREQKIRLDREFGQMSTKIADRREQLAVLDQQLQSLDQLRQKKESDLRELEKKLVVLLEEQQLELTNIKQKQDARSQVLVDITAGKQSSKVLVNHLDTNTSEGTRGGGATAAVVTAKQRAEANALVESTETMMKFGFMSMSMTYFSSMNMISAMRKVGVHQTILDGAVAAGAGVAETTSAESTQQSQRSSKPPAFEPPLRPGQLPGQQSIQVASWNVADVSRWLDTLALGQYQNAFGDAAIDGQFLYDLDEHDLKNTLGIDHALHRKKILNSVQRLKAAEAGKELSNTPSRLLNLSYSDERRSGSIINDREPERTTPAPPTSSSSSSNPSPLAANLTPANPETVANPTLGVLNFNELANFVRHGKTKQLKKALESAVEASAFDVKSVAIQYEQGVGTVYDQATNQRGFHLNQTDDKGNTLLAIAAQNNAAKTAEVLLKYGANVNHQNKQGQTGAHYAMAYDYFDLGAWLLDPEKGGARDDLMNMYDLGPYDGLG